MAAGAAALRHALQHIAATRTCDQQQTRRQLLQEYNAAATVPACEQDQHCASRDVGAQLCGGGLESALGGLGHILCRVPLALSIRDNVLPEEVAASAGSGSLRHSVIQLQRAAGRDERQSVSTGAALKPAEYHEKTTKKSSALYANAPHNLCRRRGALSCEPRQNFWQRAPPWPRVSSPNAKSNVLFCKAPIVAHNFSHSTISCGS